MGRLAHQRCDKMCLASTIRLERSRVRNKLLTKSDVVGWAVSANQEWVDDTGSLRRFGLALVRDERYVVDDAAAVRLVDKLSRQACVAAVSCDAPSRLSPRARAFAQFVRLYRRHIRRLALDEDANWCEGASARGTSVVSGVRALSIELREALLFVALAGFSHREAAEALDIPLARLLERLEQARCRLAAQMGVSLESTADTGWRGAPHLRIIK